jgi:GNAT superfamily N-acetyltransferase
VVRHGTTMQDRRQVVDASGKVKGIVLHELEPAFWPDLESLFGSNGACGGCWCWWWRLAGVEHWDDVKGEVAHARLSQAVAAGSVHGMLAFDGDTPVGWCSFEPRSSFPRLERSPSFKRTPSAGVWFVGCFFIQRSSRRRGLAEVLLAESLKVMQRDGAQVVDACPKDTHGKVQPDAFVYMGTRTMFERQGFHPVPGSGRGIAVMRRQL